MTTNSPVNSAILKSELTWHQHKCFRCIDNLNANITVQKCQTIENIYSEVSVVFFSVRGSVPLFSVFLPRSLRVRNIALLFLCFRGNENPTTNEHVLPGFLASRKELNKRHVMASFWSGTD